MKIIQVINAMVSNPNLISSVVRNGSEYFFIYNNKYKWSISLDEAAEYYLHLYPGENPDFDTLVSYNGEWTDINFVTYNTKEYKTPEAFESFSELYTLVSNKLLGVDDIFEDILSGF